MILDELITDRSDYDVEYLMSLVKKGFQHMDGEEKLYFYNYSKGAYNIGDLNRVGEALNYIAANMNLYIEDVSAQREAYGVAEQDSARMPYDEITWTAREDWEENDIPVTTSAAEDSVNQYLLQVRDVVGGAEVVANLPGSMNDLTPFYANEIERALVESDSALLDIFNATMENIINISESWHFSNEIYCGEV